MRLSELIEEREAQRRRLVLRWNWCDPDDSPENLAVLDDDRLLCREIDRLQHEMVTLGDREVAQFGGR